MKQVLRFLALAALICVPWVTQAQSLSDYTVTTGTETYTSIADNGGTLLSDVTGDGGTQTVALPFAFKFGETTYPSGTTVTVRADGYLYFGSTSPNHSCKSAWTSTSTNYYVIAPFLNYDGRIDRSGGPDGAAYYAVVNDVNGDPEMLVIEFVHVECYYSTYGDYNFQVRLHSNGNISTVYGESTLSTYGSATHNFFLTCGTADKIGLSGSYAEPTKITSGTLPNFTTAPAEGTVITFVRPVITCPKPTNLAATIVPGDGTRTTFSWTENGEATSWQLCINDDEDNLIDMDQNPFTYNGLTPEVATTAKVRAYCSSTDQSQWSNTVTFTPTDAYILPLNEGSGTNYYVPFYYSSTSYYSNVASQFIIPASDLTSIQWATINNLTFYNSLATNSYGATYTVYAGEVNTITQSTFTDWASLTPVYTGSVSVSGNEMVITFDQPFQYTTGNLLIGIKLTTTGTSGSSCTWKGVSATYGASVYTTSSTSVSQASFLPQVTIEYTPGVPPSCLPPTNLAVTANGYEATFTWASDVDNYEVVYSTSATADPATLTPASVTAEEFVETMTEFGDYYFWVRANCGANGYSSWAGPASVHIGYCEPTLTSTTTTYYISRFTTTGGVTNIDNATDGTGRSYSDFYGTHSASAYPGLTIDFTITIAGGSTHGSAVWVDWNNDMTFGEDERVYHTTSYANSPHSGSFTVPTGATLGDLRMRVVSDFSSSNPSNPCSASTGEFEDYKLTITEVPSCLPPTALTLSRNGNQITATWESGATSFNIDINGTVTNNVTSPYIFNAELSTTYTVKVQANCAGNETSEWTNTQSITTPACWGGHTIEYTLTDAYSDGWNGASITIIDGCEETTLTLSSGSSTSGTINSCADYISFIWNSGYYDSECSFTFTEGGNTLFTKPSTVSDGLVLYTIGTQTCPKPTDFDDETPGARSVDLSWTENGTAEAWQLCVNNDMDNLVDVTAADLTAGVYTLGHLEPVTDYTVKVRANCGGGDYSCWSDEINFTTDVACPAPTGLTASNPKSNSFDLQWTNGGSEDWVLAYKVDGAADFTEVDLNVSDVTEEAGTISYTLGGLDAETDYIVKVRDNCEASYAGDGVSEWTAEVPFSTIAACSAQDPVVSAITHHNATVTWDGESADGFTVKYREAAHIDGLSEEFSSTSEPADWTRYSGAWNSDGTGPATTTTSGWNFGAKNFANSHAYMNMYSDWKYWLVTPSITVGSDYVMNFDVAYTKYDATTTPDQTGTDDRFVILISTDNKAHWTSLREWNNAGTGDAVLNELPVTFQPVAPIDLSAYNGQTVYIAFYGASTQSNTDNHLRIDNVTIGANVPAGDWQTKAATTTTADLTGLTAGTKYDLKVVPNCDETLESSTVQFTTLPANNKYFLTAGDWNTASNWMDEEMPTTTDNAIIRANATIPNGTVATAKKITFEGSPLPTLTLADGGQLISNNSANIIVQKNATANRWMGISAPVFFGPTNSSEYYTATNIKDDNYDLMQYTESSSTWQSQKTISYMSQERGYIYRRANATTLTFTGSTHVGSQSAYSIVTYSASDANLKGFNLIGNPYPHNIYYGAAIPTTDLAAGFYILQTNGTWHTVAGADINTTAIGVGEAIMVKASAAISPFEMTDVATAPTPSKAHTATLAFTVSNDEYSDVAYAMFSNGEGLPKISHLNPEAPMLSIDGYAIANLNEGTESFPMSFSGNGEYTLTVSGNTNVTGYLHLVDRLTGRDIDLLSTPSYSFTGSPVSDRFTVKLTPDANEGNSTSRFAIFDGNSLIVNGEGTLEVYDVMGRRLMSAEVTGSEYRIPGSDLHTGVYVLRMNGNSQKIVIK